MTTISHIASEDDYNRALARIEEILHADPGTPPGDERDALFDLIEAYEGLHYPVELPGVLAAIEFHMEQHSLTLDDLSPLVGDRAAASAMLAGQMDITMPIARALHKHWGIPADVLLQEPANAISQ